MKDMWPFDRRTDGGCLPVGVEVEPLELGKKRGKGRTKRVPVGVSTAKTKVTCKARCISP